MRVYLDHNATTPLRSEARATMVEAMDVVGNPSSVHAEGRSAKMLVERARVQVAELVGCLPAQVIFTGSATEAAALAVAQKVRHGGVFAALPTEHDCLLVWSSPALAQPKWKLGARETAKMIDWLTAAQLLVTGDKALIAWSAANSETGMLGAEAVPGNTEARGLIDKGTVRFSVISDITQLAGKMPVNFGGEKPSYMILSAHKIGGPKGVGAFINLTADDPLPILRGGGQEQNRRSGTENIIGIAGFGAAAEAAKRDVDAGAWEKVAELRSILENGIAARSNSTIFVGKEASRLPNTSCMITPGWKGETQVMQMDLAGFAISAGSACSSGKVKASTVLQAMGYSEADAGSAVRVSLGLETTEEDVTRFVEAWGAKYEKHQQRAA